MKWNDDAERRWAFLTRESQIIRSWEQTRKPFLRKAAEICGYAMPSLLLHSDGTITQADDGMTPEMRQAIEAIRATLTEVNRGLERDLAELRRVYHIEPSPHGDAP